jgi:hypothetical protein
LQLLKQRSNSRAISDDRGSFSFRSYATNEIGSPSPPALRRVRLLDIIRIARIFVRQAKGEADRRKEIDFRDKSPTSFAELFADVATASRSDSAGSSPVKAELGIGVSQRCPLYRTTTS